ncbi:threonine/serine dehydratase [Nocardioides sp.]|uniref:threonine/serine dehydratase n=1 Tax=Nocardioides sp. TaxID=35761 RepID=UPI003518CA0B
MSPDPLTRADVDAAAARIAPFVRRTPTATGAPWTTGSAAEPWLKLELLQHAGVFKTRGAFNRLLAARERGELSADAGVVIASGGNAGLATAYAARALDVRATVVVPISAPAVKVARLEAYGARVLQVGSEYAEAAAAAAEEAQRTGALTSHAYDHPDVVAGAGTLALELVDDAAGIDTVVVAVGGGGLFAGIAAAVEPLGLRVVAVEPTTIPTLRAALAEGGPVDVSVGGVAADSLGARRIGDIAFEVAQRTGPTSVLVEDDAIVAARSQLWHERRLAVEHGAAAAYAALSSGAYTPEDGERVAVVLCGANTDPRDL